QLIDEPSERCELHGFVAVEPAVAAIVSAGVERLIRRLETDRGDPVVRVQPAGPLEQPAFARDFDANEALLKRRAPRLGPRKAELPGPVFRTERLVDGSVLVDHVGRGHMARPALRRAISLPERQRGARAVADGVMERDSGLVLRFGEVLRLRQLEA